MTRTVSISTLALTLLFAFIPATSLAQTSTQASERPFHVGGGGGVAIELDRYPTQGAIVEQFGWHFLGTTDGPFIELSLMESFGSDLFTFQATPRVGWDIALVRGPSFGLLLAPSVAAGVVVAAVSVNTGFGTRSGSDAAFDVQGAFDVKLLLLDEQLEIFLRPAAVDLFIDSEVTARYDVLAGANFRF